MQHSYIFDIEMDYVTSVTVCCETACECNTATYLTNNLIKRLESHGEVVIVIQVSHALLALTLIVTVAVAAPPCMAVTIAPPQVGCSAPSQSTCAETLCC